MKFLSKIFSTAIAIGFSLTVYQADAQSAVQSNISLKQVIEHTLKHSPMMDKAKLDLKKSETAVEQVDAMKILPTVNFQLRTGIVPEARGDVFHSSDSQTDLDGFGPFFQTELKLVQPLFTFGRISNAEKAAKGLVDVQAEKNKGQIDNLTSMAVQAYWTAYSTNEAVKIANELNSAYDTLMVKIKEEIAKEDSELDQSYLFEAQSSSFVIRELLNSSKSNRALSKSAFAEITLLNIDDSTKFDDTKLPVCELSEGDLPKYLSLAKNSNPEMLQIEAGLKAIDSKIEYEKSRNRPLIYLAGGVAYGVAPNRDDQKNPFVYDNFNYINLAAFLGLSWDLNFTQPNIEAKKWDFEKMSLVESKKLLESKITVEAAKAFYDVVNNYKSTIEITQSLQAAQSWVAMSYDNWEMGVGEPERLIKAMTNYFQIRGKKLEKEYNYSISLAKFAQLTGNFNNYLEWISNEKVQVP